MNDEIFDFVVGDFVTIKNTNTSGEIIEILSNKKNAVIKTGTIKMKVKFDAFNSCKESQI